MVLLIILTSGCSKIANKCDPNYELTQDHRTSDEELIGRYVSTKQCSDGSPVQQITITKKTMTGHARSILYCESENHYLVADVYDLGPIYYSFEGKPCK